MEQTKGKSAKGESYSVSNPLPSTPTSSQERLFCKKKTVKEKEKKIWNSSTLTCTDQCKHIEVSLWHGKLH